LVDVKSGGADLVAFTAGEEGKYGIAGDPSSESAIAPLLTISCRATSLKVVALLIPTPSNCHANRHLRTIPATTSCPAVRPLLVRHHKVVVILVPIDGIKMTTTLWNNTP